MNSLPLGFFYIVGLSWAFAETCVMAANGDWTPLIVFLVGFTLMFSILGCAKISDAAVDRWGGIFALLLGLGLVFCTVHTFVVGSTGLGVVKGIFSIAYLIGGVLSFKPPTGEVH